MGSEFLAWNGNKSREIKRENPFDRLRNHVDTSPVKSDVHVSSEKTIFPKVATSQIYKEVVSFTPPAIRS